MYPKMASSLFLVGTFLLFAACTPNGPTNVLPNVEPDVEARDGEHPPMETPVMVAIKVEHLHFKEETDPDEALARIRSAFLWHSEQPRQAGVLSLRTIEELSQDHHIEVRTRENVLDLHVYPADQNAMWEVMFTINEANQIVNMITATLEEAPSPSPDE